MRKESRMFFKFLPKEFNFFDLFDKQVDCALSAARYFKELMSKGGVSEEAVRKMGDIEHEGDEISHDIFEHLNKTFITPIDREDIHALAKELDNVTDMLNTIVSRLWIYKLTTRDENLVRFAAVINESVEAVHRAVKGLRNMKNSKHIQEACVEINRLENVGDDMRDSMLADLFQRVKDPILVIKLKEIYQDAETVLDVCEDVTHAVGSILLKQA
jgi:predicted phosphate transport protein (TIGR00153 family)